MGAERFQDGGHWSTTTAGVYAVRKWMRTGSRRLALLAAGFGLLVLAAGAAFAALSTESEPATTVADGDPLRELPQTDVDFGRAGDALAPAPASPFSVRGPGAGLATRLGVPDLSGVPYISDVEAVRREIPRAGLLGSEDNTGLQMTGVEAQRAGDGAFLAGAYYSAPDRQTVRILSWTYRDRIELVVPTESPATQTRQTTIAGLPSVTMFPAPDVLGLPPRDVFLASNGVAYWIQAQGFTSDAAVIRLAEQLAAEVTK